MPRIEAHDYGKMAMLTIVIVASIVMGVIEGEFSIAKLVIPAVLGYLTGNGVNAARGEYPSPALRARVIEDDMEPQQAPGPMV